MTIFMYKGTWVASEKLAEERRALQLLLLEHLEAFLQQHHCHKVDVLTWSHEESDSIIHLSCIPRTHG